MDFTSCTGNSLPDVKCWKLSYTLIRVFNSLYIIVNILCACMS